MFLRKMATGLLTPAVAGLLICNALSPTAGAQQRSLESKLEFEVASIRPSAGTPNYVRLSPEPEGLTGENIPVKTLMAFAYNVQKFQILGGPGWIDAFPKNTYHIQAKATRPVTTAELRLMAQSLLADRFKLAVHQATQDLPGYALVVARGGAKLPAAKASECPPKPTTCGGVYNFGGAINPREVAERASMAQLAEELSFILGKVVVDETGETGLHDFTLQWKPDADQKGYRYYSGDPNSPEIFTAIQEQLGLKLEARKVPSPTITIEHVEEPSDN